MVKMPEAFTIRLMAITADARVMAPAIVRVANCWPAPSVMVVPAPVKVADEPVEVKAVAEEVSQEPPAEIVAEAKLRAAAPDEVRLPWNATVAPVRFRTEDHVMFEVKVVVMPGFTVRLFRGCGTRIVPPDALTTMTELPAVKAPAEVSIARIVRTLPLARSAPPARTAKVSAVIGRSEPAVVTVVVPEPPWTVRVWTCKAEPVRVKTMVDAPPLNTTALNSGPARLVPAKVIVRDEAASNVTLPVPADHDAEVDPFVQLPETVQASEPKAMYEVAAEISTLPVIVTSPDAEVRYPPARVRSPSTVKGLPPFARLPAESVRDVAESCVVWVYAPERFRVAKLCAAPNAIVPEGAVSVTVEVPELKVDAGPEVSQDPETVMDPVVRDNMSAAGSFMVTADTEIDAVVPTRAPPPEMTRLAPPVTLLPAVVKVPVRVRELLTSIALACVTVPEIVRL